MVRLGVAAALGTGVLVAAPALAMADSASAPVVADASAAGDSASALAIAEAYGHRVEVSSLDDAMSTTYVNPDGTSTAEVSATPIRVRQGSGWSMVDMTLREQADGSFAPGMSPAPVTVGGAGSTTLATLSTGGGSVSYGWPTALPAPVVSGSSATYPDVRPGVDLLVTVTTSGFEVSVVFKTAQAAAAGSVSLRLSAQGLTAIPASTGAVSFSDESGSVTAASPAPQGWDARLGGDPTGPGAGPVDPVPQTLSTPSGVTVSVGTPATGSLTDNLQVPGSLLSDPSTVYPLVLDPGVVCTDCSETEYHGYVENDGDNEMDTGFDNGYIHVGTFDGGTTKARGLIAFKQGDTHAQHIVTASLKLKNVYSWSCTDEPITIYKSNSFDKSATWSTSTLPSSDDADPTHFFADGYNSSCPAADESFYVSTIATDEANDSTGYYYLQLRADESNDMYWKKFDDSGATLEVTYDSIPSGVSGQKVTSCFAQCSEPAITSDTTPVLYADATTADGDTLNYHFEVGSGWSGSAGTVVTKSNISSGTPYSFSWPTALATGNHNYEYRVTACDNLDDSVCGPTSGWFEFTVDTLPPAQPTATSSAFDLLYGSTKGSEEPGQVTFSAGDSSTYEIAYSLDSGTPVFSSPCSTATSSDIFTLCTFPSTVTVVPDDQINTLTAWAWSKAGVISAAKTWTFKVASTMAGSPDHAWVDYDANDGSGTVSDWSGAASPLSMTLAGDASWLGPESGPHEDALNFPGTLGTDGNAGAWSAGVPVDIDATHSFTAAVWVKPAVVNDGAWNAVMSTESTSTAPNPMFWLQEHAGVWKFCMPDDEISYSNAIDCVASQTTDSGAPNVSKWSLVIAQWDAGQRQMGLYVYTDDGTGTAASYTLAHTAVQSTLPVSVVLGRTTNNYELFDGDVADPLVYNSVLDETQRTALWGTPLPSSITGEN